MEHMKPMEIMDKVAEMFPDAGCELNHKSVYQLAVAVILSAQTTDASVNRVTPKLFAEYPDIASLAEAKQSDVEGIIASLGLYRNKARSIIAFAKKVVEEYGGEIPDTMEELTKLPGVGRKCANVILAECFHVPALAVDTHVSRVSKRLGLAYAKDDVNAIERKLMRKIPKERWIASHHQLIHFGRYLCHSRNPQCARCPFVNICHEKNKNFKTRTA